MEVNPDTMFNKLENSKKKNPLEMFDIHVSDENGLETWTIPASADTKYLSHSYFRYIGQFPPQIAKALIQLYGKEGGILLDPMCGGGTTLLEARLSKMHAIGCDINDVSIIWSKARATHIETSLLQKEIEFFITNMLSLKNDTLDKHLSNKKIPKFTLKLKEEKKFFSKTTIEEIEHALSILKLINNSDIQNFILATILSILRQVSLANNKKMNVVIDHESKKYDFCPTLVKKLRKMVETNMLLSKAIDKTTTLNVMNGDSRNLDLHNNSIDLVIVHPPYPTNTSFAESLRLQLSLLGKDYRKLHNNEIQIRGSYFHKPDGLRRFIIDWNKTLQEIYRVLKPGQFCGVVIGDGKIDFVRIPMGTITCELAKDIGFTVEKYVKHILVNNTGRTLDRRMTHDYVIVLKKDQNGNS